MKKFGAIIKGMCHLCAYLLGPQKTDKSRYNESLNLKFMLTEELKKKVADFVEMEQRLCSTQLMTAEYVARCMQISLEDVIKK